MTVKSSTHHCAHPFQVCSSLIKSNNNYWSSVLLDQFSSISVTINQKWVLYLFLLETFMNVVQHSCNKRTWYFLQQGNTLINSYSTSNSQFPVLNISYTLFYRSLINIVSSTTGNIVGVFREHLHLVTAIQVQFNKETIVICSSSVDGSIFVWNLVSYYSYL